MESHIAYATCRNGEITLPSPYKPIPLLSARGTWHGDEPEETL